MEIVSLLCFLLCQVYLISCDSQRDNLTVLYGEAQHKVLVDSLHSADSILNIILLKVSGMNNCPEIGQSALRLKQDMSKCNPNYVNEMLALLHDDEYALLNQNKLFSSYFSDSAINAKFLKLLYENRTNRNQAIIDKKKRERQQELDKIRREQENENSLIALRKEYGDKLRENYLDQSLDIKVSIYGSKNTIIKLTFALFNDVWTHKMQKGTLIQEIQSKGFKKLILTDGYDYTVYWDF